MMVVVLLLLLIIIIMVVVAVVVVVARSSGWIVWLDRLEDAREEQRRALHHALRAIERVRHDGVVHLLELERIEHATGVRLERLGHDRRGALDEALLTARR